VQCSLKDGEVGFGTRRGYIPERSLYRRGCGRKLLCADVARDASHGVRNALGTFVVSRRKRFADLLSGLGLRLAETEEELPIEGLIASHTFESISKVDTIDVLDRGFSGGDCRGGGARRGTGGRGKRLEPTPDGRIELTGIDGL
jgi:hypothetical protein